jgi:hypothetical protein
MLSEGRPFKVVRAHGSDEVLAPDLFSTASARVRLPPPNPPPSLRATADAPTASFKRHVLPKDLPAAIRQLDDQELDRLQAAVLAEQKATRQKACRVSSAVGQAADRGGCRSFDASQDERCSRRLQGWRQAIADRPAVRLVPVRRAAGAGERCIEVSAGHPGHRCRSPR